MELIKGVISNVKIRRCTQDFVMSQVQHESMEVGVAGMAAMGMGAQAIGLLNISSNTEEDADWVEFELGGRKMHGWLWKMPMQNGDEVEVVVDRRLTSPDVVYSIRRPEDCVVAVYPHATCGRSARYRSVMKIMLWTFVVCFSIFSFLFFYKLDGKNLSGVLPAFAVTGVLCLMMFWGLFYIEYRKLSGPSILAESIFECYGWVGVRKIDLVMASRRAKPHRIASDYGKQYFMYYPNDGWPERARK